MGMLDGLVDFEVDAEAVATFVPDEQATPSELLDAKVKTTDWLKSLGADDEHAITQAETRAAQTAFAALTSPLSTEQQKNAIAKLQVPAAVQHLVGMLTAYDWAFVDQAKELRGYAVAQIVEETKHPDARIRLKALDMLGRITEVGLFTEKVHITHKVEVDETELAAALDAEIAARMEKYAGLAAAVPDYEDVEVVMKEIQGPREHPDPDPEPHPE